MPDKNNVLKTIILDCSLTKKEKLKKMYIFMRKNYPKENKDFIFDYCEHYYEKNTQKKYKNETIYYG
jgi:hypothetical protein